MFPYLVSMFPSGEKLRLREWVGLYMALLFVQMLGFSFARRRSILIISYSNNNLVSARNLIPEPL